MIPIPQGQRGIQNNIVMVSGKQGVGKTMVMTALGYMNYLSGIKIYSSYWLNFDFEAVTSIDDLYKMRNGLFLADELWRWLSARRSMKIDNLEILSDVVENLRKRNMNMIFSTHNPMHIDTMVRRITTHSIFPDIIPLIVPDDDYIAKIADGDKQIQQTLRREIYKTISNPENYGIRVTIYEGDEDKPNNSFVLENLAFWGKLYDTRQEIGKLKQKQMNDDENNNGNERLGVKGEKKLLKKLHKKGVEAILIENSGAFTGIPGDVLAEKNLLDKKGILFQEKFGKKYAIIDLRSHNWEDYFICEKKWGLKPWFVIEYPENKWWFVPLEKDSKFIKNKVAVNFSKLKKNAITLNTFCEKFTSVGEVFS